MEPIALNDGQTAEEVAVFALGEHRTVIWKCSDGSWVVTDTRGRKALRCLCYEHASEVMGGCVKNMMVAEA